MYILFLFVALVVLLLLLKYSGYVTGGLTTQKTNYLHDLSLVDGDESSSKWVVSSKPSWVAHSKYRKVVSNSTNLRNNYKTDFKVLVTTWNVGDTAPNYEQFASLSQDVYDFVVIGTQECAFAARNGHLDAESDWFKGITSTFGDSYEVVCQESTRDSIRLIVLAHETISPSISDIRVSSYSTTVPLFWRKGAVGVSFKLYNILSLAFINVHLAAHQNESSTRDQEIETIFKNLQLGNLNFDCSNQFDHCFFFGDMNYRIDMNPTEALELINKSQWATLYQNDQLRVTQANETALVEYVEGKLNFAPTFKIQRGTRLNFDKKRVPSWCDRILAHSMPAHRDALKLLEYMSVDGINTSDHVPVMARYAFTLPVSMAPSEGLVTYGLVLSALSMNLKGFQSSLPRIVLTGPILAKEPHKALVAAEPHFEEMITTVPTTKAFMQYQHLFVSVYHSTGESTEQLIGQGVIVMTSGNFVCNLISGGLQKGTLSGSLQLDEI